MNSKRSMWKLLMSVAGASLLVTNCTIKSSDDDNGGAANNTAGANSSAGAGNSTSGDCSPVGKKVNGCVCPGNLVSYQLCQDDGTYGACVCATGQGGGSNSAGASNGGASVATAGATAEAGTQGEEAGAGGSAPVVYATCEDCLADRCQAQWDACDADARCLSANIDGSGQYERIAKCINEQRVSGLVKRDVVRGCGVTIGASADPDVISAWAPEGMDPVTTALLNCMADAPGAAAASWANDDANYPVDAMDNVHPTPWPANTCAKDACTSAL